MTTLFPTNLDELSNPTSETLQSGGPRTHSEQHGDLNDAVEALQAKVGVDGSAVTTSLDYLVAQALAGGTAGSPVVISVAGRAGNVALVPADVGLANASNTSDADKPVSTAQAAANVTDRARANHTGTQTASTISNFDAAADARVAAAALELLADVTITAPSALQIIRRNAANTGWENGPDATGGGGGGGAGPTPTGTGFRRVTLGVEDTTSAYPTKSDVGLANIDNTSDANKPVSTAQAAANVTDRARTNHTGTQLAATVSDFSAAADARISVTPLGLLSDVTVSTPIAGQVIKRNAANTGWENAADATGGGAGGTVPTGTGFRRVAAGAEDGTASFPTKSEVGLGNADNTTDANKPVSTAQATALALKANLSALAADDGSNLVGYVSDLAGAVARTTRSRLRNLDLDWSDFGIVADGIADDSTAFELALNRASGRRLILPAGTAGSPRVIRLTRQLAINSGTVPIWMGGGADKTIIRYASATVPSSDVISISGAPRGVRIQGVGFDQNGATTTGSWGMLGFANAEDLEIAFCSFYGFDKMGLILNGPRYFKVHNNRFTRTAPSTTYNEAFLVSAGSQSALYGEFNHNVCVNAAVDVHCTNMELAHNTITGWSFGGGITTEQGATSLRYTIRNNQCSGSIGIDSNLYRPGGIENWGTQSVITGNRCFSNSGSGMDQGGSYSHVEGNYCFNNGQSGPGNVGIVTRYDDATYNGSYSTYIGNTCFDSQGTKTQDYGYVDQSASLTGITHRGNKYGAHVTGTENILASSTDWNGPELHGSFTVDPASVAAGTSYVTDVTLSGAAMGDFVQLTFSLALQGLNLWGHVLVGNTVRVYFDNNSAGTIDLASGTLRAKVSKPRGYAAFL